MSEYRRLFIIRKDLNLSHGKMAAMVGHCAEIYWINMIREGICPELDDGLNIQFHGYLDDGIYDNYIQGLIIKTICEAKNLNHLKKAEKLAADLGLELNEDFGYINDRCLTELTPENEDGTTTVGMWFKPLPTEVAHQISKKYQLYK